MPDIFCQTILQSLLTYRTLTFLWADTWYVANMTFMDFFFPFMFLNLFTDVKMINATVFFFSRTMTKFNSTLKLKPCTLLISFYDFIQGSLH